MTSQTFIRRRGNTVLPNATIFDDRISIPALGLLALILARPSTAPQGYRSFIGRGLGKEGLLNAFRELGSAGYRHQVLARSPDGRVLTFTVVSEDPIPDDVAREWLLEQLADPEHRARDSAARRDLRKRAQERSAAGKTAGGTVRGLPGSGEPGSGEPGSGEPGSGEPPHKPSVSKVPSSLRSQEHNRSEGEQRIPSDFRTRIPGSETDDEDDSMEAAHGP